MQKAGRYFASATYLDLWLGQERREPPRDLLWTLTATAMIATAVGGPLGVPTGLAVGLAVGLVNGLGGCLSAVRSMIFTLGTLGVNAVMRGLMVAHPGGLRAADRGEDLMRLLGAERIMSVPVALLVWAAVSALLNRTTFGKALYLIGNREAAAYLQVLELAAL